MKYTAFHKENLIKLIKRFQPEFDEQTVDYEALWDSSLGTIENYKNILATMNISYAEKDLDIKGLDEKNSREGMELEEQHSTQVFTEELKHIAGQEQPSIDAYFEDIYGYIDTVVDGKTHSLIVRSEGGLGKTYNVLKYLTAKGKEFNYVSGWITKLELYQFLHEHQNSLIVFDDCEIMLEDDGIIALLKPALWETVKEKRIISYISSSEKLTVPKQFIFGGKIIMLINEVPFENRRTVKALLSRSIFFDLEFDYEEKIKLLYEIAKLPFGKLEQEDRLAVAEFIKKNTDETFEDLNLRTLIKGLDLRATCPKRWQALLKNLLVENEELRILKECIYNHPTIVGDAVSEFIERTGKSRITFFRLKRRLKKSVKVSL